LIYSQTYDDIKSNTQTNKVQLHIYK